MLCGCIKVLKQCIVEYGIFKPTDFRGAPGNRREAVGLGQRTGGVHPPPQRGGVASLEGSLAHVDPAGQVSEETAPDERVLDEIYRHELLRRIPRGQSSG